MHCRFFRDWHATQNGCRQVEDNKVVRYGKFAHHFLGERRRLEIDDTRRQPCAFTVPKLKGQKNEDWYQLSSKGQFALSDGASISFDSASWSRILARRFARCPHFSKEWLAGAIEMFGQLHNRDSLPWMEQASFDRGSFATLLGVRRVTEESVEIFAVGDSLAVLCDGNNIQKTFPYSDPSQFRQSPQLLCTNYQENAFLDGLDLSAELLVTWTFSGLEQPAILCLTDALGEWLLSRSDRQQALGRLRRIRTQRDFAEFVHTERAGGRMRRDDTTLVATW
jgi:hypothetical protein